MVTGATAGLGAAAVTAYALCVRPWHLSWGATPEELTAPMPFDTLITRPNYFATRAITIAATPERVWPLLVDTRALPKGTIIRTLDEGRSVVFAPPEVEAEATWVVAIHSDDSGATRVVSRTRARFGRNLRSVARYLFVDPGQFIVERNWLLGLKERAERA